MIKDSPLIIGRLDPRRLKYISRFSLCLDIPGSIYGADTMEGMAAVSRDSHLKIGTVFEVEGSGMVHAVVGVHDEPGDIIHCVCRHEALVTARGDLLYSVLGSFNCLALDVGHFLLALSSFGRPASSSLPSDWKESGAG